MKKLTVIIILLFWAFYFAGAGELRIEKVLSGKGINTERVRTTVNETAAEPLRIKVYDDDSPVKGIQVNSVIVNSPESESPFRFLNEVAITNENGIAEFYYNPGDESGDCLVSVYVSEKVSGSPVICSYNIEIFSDTWVWKVVFGLLGGLALFLTGINMMSEGLRKSLGNRLQNILTTSTGNRLKGLSTGVILSTVTQSSSAVSVMLISFVDSNLVKFSRTMAVTMGAALGTTITVQLIAFRVTDFALVLVGFGFILEFLWRKTLIKNIGHSLLGTGLLFLGMYIMSESIAPLKTYDPFYDALLTMENPLAGVLAGCIFTAVTQSSSMFIGIVVILGGHGLLSLEAAIPMLLGSNLGTSVTALIASVGRSTDAKKVAVSHTLYRIAGILFVIAWIGPFADMVRAVSISETVYSPEIALPRQIANSHTLFYLMFTIAALPFSHLFVKLTHLILRGREEPEYARMEARYLDKSLYDSPSMALNLSRRETARMIHFVQDMLNDIMLPFLTKERNVLTNIRKLEDVINFLQKEIQDYTICLISNLNDGRIIREGYKIISVSKECEQIADIISTNLLPRAEKWVDETTDFSNEGKKEIMLFQNESQQILNDVLHSFEANDKISAHKAKKSYRLIMKKALEFEKSHYQRLLEQNPLSHKSSEIHIELIGMLNAVARHASNMAKIIEDKAGEEEEAY